MTDITELAQSLKAAAEKATPGNWRAFQYHDGRCGIGGGHNAEIMVCEHISKERPHDAMFIALANPANVLALVEALEKAQTINAAAEKLVRCKGRYHSEQNYRALAALFGVKTPDLPPLEHENVHYADAAEMEIAALRQRIAELESRTVKLPKLKMLEDYLAEVAIEERKQILVGVKLEFHRALAVAGIKVEAE